MDDMETFSPGSESPASTIDIAEFLDRDKPLNGSFDLTAVIDNCDIEDSGDFQFEDFEDLVLHNEGKATLLDSQLPGTETTADYNYPQEHPALDDKPTTKPIPQKFLTNWANPYRSFLQEVTEEKLYFKGFCINPIVNTSISDTPLMMTDPSWERNCDVNSKKNTICKGFIDIVSRLSICKENKTYEKLSEKLSGSLINIYPTKKKSSKSKTAKSIKSTQSYRIQKGNKAIKKMNYMEMSKKYHLKECRVELEKMILTSRNAKILAKNKIKNSKLTKKYYKRRKYIRRKKIVRDETIQI